MRKLVVLVASALLLSGCAGVGAPSLTPEAEFVKVVKAQIVGAEDVDSREVIDLGTAVCTALDNGYSESELVTVGGGNGFTDRELGVIIHEAHQYLCPDGGQS